MKKTAGLIGLSILATLLLVGGFGWLGWQQLKDTRLGVNIDAPILTTYHAEKDITYCNSGGNAQKLNLYIPDSSGKAYPLLIYIHGGGWYTGSKDTAAIESYIPDVARLGYVVASVDYRLSPTYTFPAQVQDIKCAIRYLRANASGYTIDPARVGVIGESAGGYLAAFAGATGDDKTYQTSEYAQYSDTVQAVVDLFGPSTFTDTPASAAATRMARNFLGDANPTTASVVTHVSRNDPPTLIIHGTNDSVVPLRQSQVLHRTQQSADVSSRLLQVAHAEHGLSATPGMTIAPSLPDIRQEITLFLHKELQ